MPPRSGLRCTAGTDPASFQATLRDPQARAGAAELVRALQSVLARYSGVMEVVAEGPGAQLEVADLPGGISPAEAEALRARAWA